ncbi:hypothetical protein B5E41_22140 [Rhizobium esperanzae]|uniref:Uncharacterized protein n=1 Tax=Rhizobium esperanzae TaxID=1967781 RepID=A0A246DQD5_9HYPH|nr:hypothetical protein B5E41_22140 [Rhizobium esperanzae]
MKKAGSVPAFFVDDFGFASRTSSYSFIDPSIHAASILLVAGRVGQRASTKERKTDLLECCVWMLGSRPSMTEVEGHAWQEA